MGTRTEAVLACTGERRGLVVEPRTPEREMSGFDTYFRRAVSLSKDTFTLRKVLAIPRKRWLRPDMTEKLFTGTFSLNKTKTNLACTHNLCLREIQDETTTFYIFKNLGRLLWSS